MKRGGGSATKIAGAPKLDEEELNEDQPVKRTSNNPIGRPKGEKKLDIQFKKKADQTKTTIATIKKLVVKGTIKEEDEVNEMKDAIKELFEEDFDDQGEGILEYLAEKRERQDDSVREKNDKFTASLNVFKTECSFDKEQDNFLASIRKANLDKLEEHERFLEIGQLALKYYRELFLTQKTDDAKEDALVLSSLKEIKEEKRNTVFDTNRFKSASSQDADD